MGKRDADASPSRLQPPTCFDLLLSIVRTFMPYKKTQQYTRDQRDKTRVKGGEKEKGGGWHW